MLSLVFSGGSSVNFQIPAPGFRRTMFRASIAISLKSTSLSPYTTVNTTSIGSTSLSSVTTHALTVLFRV